MAAANANDDERWPDGEKKAPAEDGGVVLIAAGRCRLREEQCGAIISKDRDMRYVTSHMAADAPYPRVGYPI